MTEIPTCAASTDGLSAAQTREGGTTWPIGLPGAGVAQCGGDPTSGKNEISAAELAGQCGADAGGASPSGVARNQSPAVAGDPTAAVPQRTTSGASVRGVSSLSALADNSPGAGDGAGLFWERVNSGEVRLTNSENETLARMCADGETFAFIAATLGYRIRARLKAKACGRRWLSRNPEWPW